MTTITIGYTQHKRVDDYEPFWDTWRPGQPQHEITIEVELEDSEPSTVAENVFHATNAPEVPPETDAGRILAAIKATGYRGEGAHWTVSIGDTVTVPWKGGQMRLGCARLGWEVIKETQHESEA